MINWRRDSCGRRDLLRATLLAPIGVASAGLGSAWAQPAAPAALACAGASPAETEGPYFKPQSPERTTLIEPGMAGTKLILTGYVLSAACKLIAGTLLDFWHADEHGAYDNAGYRLRGHQFTDEQGHYVLETILPGVYTGRTRHIHVKVQPQGGRLLTTQLYFPDEPRNTRDSLFQPKLLIALRSDPMAKLGRFDFVVA
ncbi:MAG TPA: intradiol ring-cleavage dioxygenase [Stellaceae bacterium]|nr:intradiol ring-cleavage dioxygenase [Stellaceae bacterium]